MTPEELKSFIDGIKEAKEKGNILTAREIKILEMRFGIEDGIMHTLEETGEMFGVTRERIRQMQAKALERIRMSKVVENKPIKKSNE